MRYTIIATDCPVRTRMKCPLVKTHTPLMNSETVERTRKLIGFETMKPYTVKTMYRVPCTVVYLSWTHG